MLTPKQRFGTHLSAIFVLFLLCLFPTAAHAQAISQYTNVTSGAIPESTTCATTLSRTFSVTSSYVVNDVDIGVLISHNTRSNLRLTLTSPSGTVVNLITNSGGNNDHLNVLFDDEAAASISTHASNDTISAVPPYQRTFRPIAALSAFDGQNALGTWTLQICDSVAGTTGTFTEADLYITQPYADLSLSKTVSNASPANGASASYTLSVTNASGSPSSATGVTVQDSLPLGISFVSATGDGSYNSGTGVWTVGTIASGVTRTLTINFTVTASSGATVTNNAEVRASSLIDSDSTPNNGSTTEDDDAFASFTVSGTRVAGTPPTLVCPIGSTTFDWTSYTWAAGSLANNYTLAGVGTFGITITPDVALVAGSPAINANLTGGFGAGAENLFLNMNNNNVSDGTVTVIALPTAVPGLQFRLFDVDFGSGSYADKITVTGSFNGSNVTPTLTNGIANYVTGNVAIADQSATDTTANGTVFVTFSAPVDTVTITYGNHSTAPANPGNQWMGVHDFTFCRPQATLNVTKVSSVVSDGVNATNPKAIPGAIMRYCVLVSNPGSGTATSVSVVDAIPANVTFVPGSMTSGSSCAGATTVEDDNATGADETDPFGASISGTTVTATTASLGPSASFAIRFNATVN